MINFKGNENIIFNFRAAAVIIEDEYILLHKSEKDDFFSLPGGRVEFGEKTENTVVRELKEEVNIKAEVERMLWYVEDFYTYENEKYHEICTYYLLNLKEDNFKDKRKIYIGKEGEKNLTYKWFLIRDLENIEIYPVFLKEKLKNISNYIEKIIQE